MGRSLVNLDRWCVVLLSGALLLIAACSDGETEQAMGGSAGTSTADSASDGEVAATPSSEDSGTGASCDGTLGVPVGIPDTSVAVPVPDGFYVVSNFTGLFNDEYLASVVVFEMPETLDEVFGDIDGLVEGLETQQGVVSLQVDEIELGGRRAHIVRAWQQGRGARFEKWAVVVEGTDSMLMLTAQVPLAEGDAVFGLLRDVLLCAEWTPGLVHEDPLGPLFEIDVGALFVEEINQAGAKGYIAGDSAYFFITPSLAAVAVSDREQAALGAFASLGPGPIDETPVVVEGPVSIMIDGLPGLLIRGTGVNEGEPILLYQVMLFTPDGIYYRLLGSSPTARAGELMPQIEAMAESFRLLR